MSLSALELAQLRADHEDYMPDTCTIQTKTVAIGAAGGWTETWTDTATVDCRLAPTMHGLGEIINAAQLASLTSWVLTVHHDQAISAEQRVVVGGDTYEVERVEDDHSHRTARRAYLRRLD
jgi:SPP1 family predicted phage head-tail adaptor